MQNPRHDRDLIAVVSGQNDGHVGRVCQVVHAGAGGSHRAVVLGGESESVIDAIGIAVYSLARQKGSGAAGGGFSPTGSIRGEGMATATVRHTVALCRLAAPLPHYGIPRSLCVCRLSRQRGCSRQYCTASAVWTSRSGPSIG